MAGRTTRGPRAIHRLARRRAARSNKVGFIGAVRIPLLQRVPGRLYRGREGVWFVRIVPGELVSFAPHLTTLLVLAFARQRLRPPAALGVPFR